MGLRSTLRWALAHRWVSVGIVAVVAGGVTTAVMVFGADSPASASITYRTTTAALATIRQSVSSTGTLEPADQDDVNFAVSGTVTSVRVAQGDRVRAGQALATVDSAALKSALAQAQATLASAQARVASDETSSATDSQLSADQAAVSAAQGQVDSASTALADAVLRSPITGVIASVDVAVGDTVSGSAGGGGGGSNNGSSSTSQFVVISTDRWTVSASADATQVGLIKKGLQVQLTVDGAATTVYGTVSSVAVIASSSSSGSASYPVDIAVTGNPAGLHAGASVTVSIIYKQLSNVLTVPALAVRDVNGKSVVDVSSNGAPNGSRVARTVTVGESGGGLVQITSGLKEGDVVFVAIPSAGGGSGSRNGTNGRFPGGFTPGDAVFGVPGTGPVQVQQVPKSGGS